jgi:hypothetical protein
MPACYCSRVPEGTIRAVYDYFCHFFPNINLSAAQMIASKLTATHPINIQNIIFILHSLF